MELRDYLNQSHSPYQAVETAVKRLQEAGFEEIPLGNMKNMEAGKSYYIPVYDTALFAVRMPEKGKSLHLMTAHTDYPAFKLKPMADMSVSGNALRVNVEPYGGMLKRTWFDRPLGLAGAIWMKGEDAMHPVKVSVDLDEPLFVIPSLAPHMDREIETKAIDVQKEIVPCYGLCGEDASILELLADRTGCHKEDILSYDLSLFTHEKPCPAGRNQELIMAQGLDNIASVAALVEGLIEGENKEQISMICLFNHEEIGSRSKEGADSNILKWALDQMDVDYEDSMIFSLDGAHAVHPNYPEKADVTSKVELGKGIAVKTSASQRYASDGRVQAVIKAICQEKEIPVQMQANRSGAPGGSTLGPIVSAYIPIPAADLGIPMLGMHSACETAAMKDYEALLSFVKEIL